MVRPLKWQNELLTLLVKDGPLYFKQIRLLFKRHTNNPNVIKRNLDGLIEGKYVKREKKGKYAYYSATFIGVFQDMINEILREEILYSLVYDDSQRFSKIFRRFRYLVKDKNDIRRILKSLIKDNRVKKGKWGIYFATINEYITSSRKQFEEYLGSLGGLAKYYDETIDDKELKKQLKEYEKEIRYLGIEKQGEYYTLALAKYYRYNVGSEYARLGLQKRRLDK